MGYDHDDLVKEEAQQEDFLHALPVLFLVGPIVLIGGSVEELAEEFGGEEESPGGESHTDWGGEFGSGRACAHTHTRRSCQGFRHARDKVKVIGTDIEYFHVPRHVVDLQGVTVEAADAAVAAGTKLLLLLLLLLLLRHQEASRPRLQAHMVLLLGTDGSHQVLMLRWRLGVDEHYMYTK